MNRRKKKRLAAVEGAAPVTGQTQVEQWVTGAIDSLTGRVCFQVDAPGREGRTRQTQTDFIEATTLPKTTVVTDESRLYSRQVLEASDRWHLHVNHSAGERVVRDVWTEAGGRIGTQKIEKLWDRLKMHLQRCFVARQALRPGLLELYLNDYAFRVNAQQPTPGAETYAVVCQVGSCVCVCVCVCVSAGWIKCML